MSELNIITVNVLCFPDGSTYWIREPTDEELRKVFDEWNKKNEYLLEAGALSGVVIIRMPESLYYAIPATNRFEVNE